MNNANVIKLINANGVAREYGEIPDLWHLAQILADTGDTAASEDVLQVWQMAHDLKSVVEGQGQAGIVEIVGPDFGDQS